ncbi:polysaccharide biosynthesis tyrosine autokinase [Epibacterium ulvae]|uniref:polysaccharide biosynthesis tyrosine autokinase n=1 Tax=Epibacterium ulvae TaxID=1156985 RepID=UPI002490A4E9|nr:AAA family ATPase [Epibacterium ulvae]
MSKRTNETLDHRSYAQYSDMGEARGSEYFLDFSALGQAIKRDIWRVLAIVALCVGCATYYAFNVTVPIYRAAASLILDTADSDVADLLGESGATQLSETELNTNISVLRSDAQLKQVIERLNLLEDPEFNPLAGQDPGTVSEAERVLYAESLASVVANNLRSAIFARNVQRTFVVTIAVTTSSAVKSKNIANTMVDVYLERQVAQKRETAQAATAWLNQRVTELQNDVIEAERRIDEFGSGNAVDGVQNGVTLRALVEQSRAVDKQYQFFLNRLAEASAQEGIYRPDGRVMSYATAPLRPIAPRKRLIVFAGFMIGLALSLSLVSYNTYISNKIRSRRGLEAVTPAPLLGVLPQSAKAQRKIKHGTFFEDKSYLYKAGIDQLLGNLLVFGKGRRGLLYTMTSCSEGEGKTTSLQALAQGHAESGRSVLLIDADLRKRSLTRQLLPEDSQGLVALYEGKATYDEVISSTENANIHMLGCEKTISQPIDLLYSDAFRDALEQARHEFDVILVDTSPVLANADLAALGEQNDGVIFIVRENATTSQQLRTALGKLKRHRLNLSGVLVTSVDKRSLSNWQHIIY